VSAAASREHMIYNADCLQEYVPAIIGTLADVIQNHQFHIEELLEEKELYELDFADKEKLLDLKMMESIHEAAYSSQTLGLPLYAPKHNLPQFTSESLKAWMNKFFTPKRMVISAVGVEHSKLVNLVEQAFSHLPKDQLDSSAKQPAVYTGGEIRYHSRDLETPLTHVAIAFETANW
jgi:predicted Zn-dependent peptidase